MKRSEDRILTTHVGSLIRPQAEGIQRVHPSVMWAKFESLAEGARLARKELWS